MTATSASAIRATGSDPIRVMVVDDSAAVRMALSDIINASPDLELMATASDPYAAAQRLSRGLPDVLVLDIEMPRMDGLTFLRKIMAQRPLPVVICSTLTDRNSETAMEAFKAGAVEVIAKPKVNTTTALREARVVICDALKAAAAARFKGLRRIAPTTVEVASRHEADVVLPKLSAARMAKLPATIPATQPLVCIGASTGGTEALATLLEQMPAGGPPIAVVQHMPENFTGAFARRLDAAMPLSVKEAEDGDLLRLGQAVIAPGGMHMLIRRRGQRYYVELRDGDLVARHRPSVDVMFRSAAQSAGPNAIGVIMTGMGDDGARGLGEMHQLGAQTFAQDEASCVVFGMPKAAIEHGGADAVVSLDGLAPAILKAARRVGAT